VVAWSRAHATAPGDPRRKWVDGKVRAGCDSARLRDRLTT
jgi:hypothetical protein